MHFFFCSSSYRWFSYSSIFSHSMTEYKPKIKCDEKKHMFLGGSPLGAPCMGLHRRSCPCRSQGDPLVDEGWECMRRAKRGEVMDRTCWSISPQPVEVCEVSAPINDDADIPFM